jgi:hypothetical protein
MPRAQDPALWSRIRNAPAPGVRFGVVVDMCGVNCYELSRLV